MGEFIKDKLNKTFNEIELRNGNYPNMEYQDLNLLDEYQAVEESDVVVLEENKIEEEPEEEPEDLRIENNGHLDVKKVEKDDKSTDDLWSDEVVDVVHLDKEEKEEEEKEENDKLIEE